MDTPQPPTHARKHQTRPRRRRRRGTPKCRRHAHLDVLVANAGILGAMQPPESLDEDNWKNVFAVNVVRARSGRDLRSRDLGVAWARPGRGLAATVGSDGSSLPPRNCPLGAPAPSITTGAPSPFLSHQDGVFHCARAAYPLLKKSGRAKIVVTSSVAGEPPPAPPPHTHACVSTFLERQRRAAAAVRRRGRASCRADRRRRCCRCSKRSPARHCVPRPPNRSFSNRARPDGLRAAGALLRLKGSAHPAVKEPRARVVRAEGAPRARGALEVSGPQKHGGRACTSATR